MTDINKQDKYKNLKRVTISSGLCALAIFLIDAFLIGAPMISVFVLLYLIFYIAPVTLFSIRNKPRFKYFGCKFLIYAILLSASIGFHAYDISIAERRSEIIIATVNQYHQDLGRYPDTLQNLVPAYLSEIPEPRIAPGEFYYGGAPDDPYLMFVDYPPFGRRSWIFERKEWISID